LVLYRANTSRAFETLSAKNCINGKTIKIKIVMVSNEKYPKVEIITINQKVNPAETASALKHGDESSILNWIDESYQSTLC